MGATKTDKFTKDQNELAILFKSIAHPARIAILEYLMSVQTCICGDIVNEIDLSQPTVSQHLKELKNAGIIKGNVEGNSICYCINQETLEKLQKYLGDINTNLKAKNNSCC